MQTTSFQGISPQFAATKPNPQSNIRQVQSPQPAQGADTVRFGAGDEKTKETTQNSDTKERSFGRKTLDGLKKGAKHIFNLGGLGQDLLIGSVLAVATAIIPPHAHALLMVPFAFLAGGLYRFCTGFFRGFRGEAKS